MMIPQNINLGMVVYTPVIPAVGKLKWEDSKFEVSLGNVVQGQPELHGETRPCLKKTRAGDIAQCQVLA
jgi:hypothetical protein